MLQRTKARARLVAQGIEDHGIPAYAKAKLERQWAALD